ncbi:MAG: hypothetical protein LBQ10_09810 [Desulfovibrio sp.]|jgi:hypothetical protein|nr:hypothetical protein [Desulfovibrio sp.]
MLSLYVDPKSYEDALRPLRAFPSQMRGALWQAVKRSLDTAKKEVVNEIAALSYLPKKIIREAVSRPMMYSAMTRGNKATKTDSVSGAVHVAGRRPWADQFRLVPKRVTARKGVRSRNWKPGAFKVGPNEPARTVQATDGRSPGFVLRGRKGLMLFTRVLGKTRTDKETGKKVARLQRQAGYSVQYFASFDKMPSLLTPKIEERFMSALKHEVEHRIAKMGKK